MARAVPEGEPKLPRPHLANDELEHGGRRLREPVRDRLAVRAGRVQLNPHARAPCRVRAGRATLSAGTWPLNSTVKTPSNNKRSLEGPVEAPHVSQSASGAAAIRSSSARL